MRAIALAIGGVVGLLLCSAADTDAFARASGYVNPSYHWVRPYQRQDGTPVQGHYQTDPNHTKCDNYSTEGNTNPHTGQAGTKPGC